MRALFSLCFLLLGLCASMALAWEKPRFTYLDASGGEMPGYQISYVTNVDGENKNAGSVLAVLTKLTGSEDGEAVSVAGYRFERAKGIDSLVLLEPQKIERILEEDSETGQVTTVELTAEQFEKAKSTVLRYSKRTDPDIKPAKGFIGCVRKILRKCGMRTPYTSPYRVPNPMEWVGDIPGYSMDLTVEPEKFEL